MKQREREGGRETERDRETEKDPRTPTHIHTHPVTQSVDIKVLIKN